MKTQPGFPAALCLPVALSHSCSMCPVPDSPVLCPPAHSPGFHRKPLCVD